MANIEQTVADTRELVELSSETLLAVEENVSKVDMNVNGVGKQVVELNKKAEEIVKTTNAQGESVREMMENQGTLKKSQENIIDVIGETVDMFEENSEQLTNIKDNLSDIEASQRTCKSDILEAISDASTAHQEDVNDVKTIIGEVSEKVEALDIHAELETLITTMQGTNDKIEAATKEANETEDKMTARMSTISNELQKATEQMEKLVNIEGEIQQDFSKSIARLGAIELQLETLTEVKPNMSAVGITEDDVVEEVETEDVTDSEENEVE